MFTTDLYGNVYFAAGVSVASIPATTGTQNKVLVPGPNGRISSASISQLITQSGGNLVSSIFGRTGVVTAALGDYNTDQITEGQSLYFSASRARKVLSVTTFNTSGPATYDSTTGIINIPQYGSGEASPANFVPLTRKISINGQTADLSVDRMFSVEEMVYPSIGIPVSNGTSWAASITNNSANWNTAYGWGDHAGLYSLLNHIHTIANVTGLQTALDSKEPTITAGTTTQYWRGDKSWQTLPIYTLSGLGGQPQLDGTGFVKASGTTITYDNSTYYLASNPSVYISGITGIMVTTALGYTPFSGTGTTNFLARFSSATALTNSLIYDNGTQVGIGNRVLANLSKIERTLNILGTDSVMRIGRFTDSPTTASPSVELISYSDNGSVRRFFWDYFINGEDSFAIRQRIAGGGVATNGVIIDALRLTVKSGGQIQFNNYTSLTSFTGTVAGYLAFDNSGNIITASFVDTNTWDANTKTVAGYVAAPGAVANKVWKTDASGNPAWRDDADTVVTSLAWTSITGRPTALSEFTNNLGNYGGWVVRTGDSMSGRLTIDTRFANDNIALRLLAIQPDLQIEATGTTNGVSIKMYPTGGSRAFVGNYSSGELAFVAEGLESVYINSNSIRVAKYRFNGNSTLSGNGTAEIVDVANVGMTMQSLTYRWYNNLASVLYMTLDNSGSLTASAFFESSDIRYKDVIETNPKITLDGLDVIKFTRKGNNVVRFGYSAQQVKSLSEDLVGGTKDELTVNYSDVHTLKIAALEKRIAELEAKLK